MAEDREVEKEYVIIGGGPTGVERRVASLGEYVCKPQTPQTAT